MDDKFFYTNKIKIKEWLVNDDNQKIIFKDRIEYRKNGEIKKVVKLNPS